MQYIIQVQSVYVVIRLHWDRRGEVGAEVNVKFTDRATVSDMTAQQLASYHLASTYETPVIKATCMFSFGYDLKL